MNLVQRATDILLKPKDTWPQIEAESSSTAGIYSQYLVFLAAIPAVAGFVGMSLIGVGGFGFSMRVPLVTGLVTMAVSYVVSLALIYVLALIIDALAPTFNATKHPLNALKVAAYSSTAAFVAGAFSALPMLSILGMLGALYSIYLLYLGLAALMKCPQDKAVAYTAVVVVIGFVLGAVLSGISSAVYRVPGATMGQIPPAAPAAAIVAAAPPVPAAPAPVAEPGVDEVDAMKQASDALAGATGEAAPAGETGTTRP